jgi:hypothetical protein
MSKTTIPTGGITADAINGTLIADDAVSEEHLDATAITGSTELAATPADTDEILISDAGTLKRIDFSHIKGQLMTPVFKASLPNNANVNNNSASVMALGTENLDTGGVYNTSTYKFTPTVEGYYFFSASVLIDFGNDAGEYGDISIQKNGNKVIAERRAVSGNVGISSAISCHGMTHMNGSGDYAQAVIFHNYGSGRDMDSNEDYTFFHGFRITGSV